MVCTWLISLRIVILEIWIQLSQKFVFKAITNRFVKKHFEVFLSHAVRFFLTSFYPFELNYQKNITIFHQGYWQTRSFQTLFDDAPWSMVCFDISLKRSCRIMIFILSQRKKWPFFPRDNVGFQSEQKIVWIILQYVGTSLILQFRGMFSRRFHDFKVNKKKFQAQWKK